MCIAIWSPVDSLIPKKTVLKNCWRNNDEGAGFAKYNPKTEKWECQKGFMTWKAFWRAFNAMTFTPVDELIVHFRVSTSGKLRSPDCTHPFPVLDDVKEMMNHKFETESIVMHNGVVGRGDGDASDSMVAVRDYIQPLEKHIEEDKILDILEELLRGDKCRWFIARKNTVYLIGDWHEKEGIHYSNHSYKWIKPAPTQTRMPFGGAHCPHQQGGGFLGFNGRCHDVELTDIPDMSILDFIPENKVGMRHFDWEKFDLQMIDTYADIALKERIMKEDKEKMEEAMKVVDEKIKEKDGNKKVIQLPHTIQNEDAEPRKTTHEERQAELTEVFDAYEDRVRALIDEDGDIVWDSDGEAYTDINDDDPKKKEGTICPHCGDDDNCMESPYTQTDPMTNIEESIGDSMCVRCGAVFVEATTEILHWDVDIQEAYDIEMQTIVEGNK